MQITNKSDGMVVFQAALPSGRMLRIELDGGDTIGVSPAMRAGLPSNDYFNNLIDQGKLEVSGYAKNSRGDGDVS